MHTDNLHLGPETIQRPGPIALNPTRQAYGYGPLGRVATLEVTPLAIATGNIAAAQTTAAAGPLVLAAGTNVTAGTTPGGLPGILLDCQRGVSLQSGVDLSAISFTLVGYDQYGRKLTSTMAGPNANTVTFPKTVKWVESITASAAVGTNVNAHTADVIGLPVVMATKDYAFGNYNQTALALSAYTAADPTVPPTPSDGDALGTVTLPSASDGTKRLVVMIVLSEANIGANANTASCYGVQA